MICQNCKTEITDEVVYQIPSSITRYRKCQQCHLLHDAKTGTAREVPKRTYQLELPQKT
jgi:hypothetical protein